MDINLLQKARAYCPHKEVKHIAGLMVECVSCGIPLILNLQEKLT